jgi:prophage regulatory protein
MTNRPIRMLRLPQVIDATGLGKTKIYELQQQGDFPTRVKITAHSVAWVEEEVQSWLAARIERTRSDTPAIIPQPALLTRRRKGGR